MARHDYGTERARRSVLPRPGRERLTFPSDPVPLSEANHDAEARDPEAEAGGRRQAEAARPEAGDSAAPAGPLTRRHAPVRTAGSITAGQAHSMSQDLPRLGAPAARALAAAGYRELDDLTRVSEAELRKLHGIGPNAIEKLRAALADRGRAFAPASRA